VSSGKSAPWNEIDDETCINRRRCPSIGRAGRAWAVYMPLSFESLEIGRKRDGQRARSSGDMSFLREVRRAVFCRKKSPPEIS
jgi:hypothetical protein